MLCTPQHNSGDQINKADTGRTCSTYGGGGQVAYRVLVRKPEGRPRARHMFKMKLT